MLILEYVIASLYIALAAVGALMFGALAVSDLRRRWARKRRGAPQVLSGASLVQNLRRAR